MANEVTIKSICSACNGTGIDRHEEPDGQGGTQWVEEDCAACGATGKVTSGEVSGDYFDDVITKLNDNNELLLEIKALLEA